jgi:hypothetical protein
VGEKAAAGKTKKKEKWALKLEEKRKELQAATKQRKAEKAELDRHRAKALRRAKADGDTEMMRSFKADDKARKRDRLEQIRHQRLAKLREGWLAELARRQKRDDARAEEKRKRHEAWEEKQREKMRRRLDYEQKKREWESKQAERYARAFLMHSSLSFSRPWLLFSFYWSCNAFHRFTSPEC